MIVHIHNPEVNIQESESRIYSTWLLSHWLHNKLSVKVIDIKLQPRLYLKVLEMFASAIGGPRSKVYE